MMNERTRLNKGRLCSLGLLLILISGEKIRKQQNVFLVLGALA